MFQKIKTVLYNGKEGEYRLMSDYSDRKDTDDNRETEAKETEAAVVCIGQAVVDCITRGVAGDPLGMGKTRAQSITLNLGGDAVNESFVLSSLGHRAALVCAVGDDLAGRFIMNEAGRRGLETGGMTAVPGLVTPVANMFVKEDGSRSSVTSAASLLPGYTPDEAYVRACVEKGARIVSFASLFRAPLDRPEIVCRLVRAAHECGAVVCADTKIPTFRSMTLEDLALVLPMIDYIFPNESEAAFLTGLKGNYEEMAEALLKRGIRHVIIKAGEKGLFAADGTSGERFMLPALKVPVVDTTGAGDNLVAGFMDGLLRGNGFRQCCEAGNRAAAKSIGHLGATDSAEI